MSQTARGAINSISEDAEFVKSALASQNDYLKSIFNRDEGARSKQLDELVKESGKLNGFIEGMKLKLDVAETKALDLEKELEKERLESKEKERVLRENEREVLRLSTEIQLKSAAVKNAEKEVQRLEELQNTNYENVELVKRFEVVVEKLLSRYSSETSGTNDRRFNQFKKELNTALQTVAEKSVLAGVKGAEFENVLYSCIQKVFPVIQDQKHNPPIDDMSRISTLVEKTNEDVVEVRSLINRFESMANQITQYKTTPVMLSENEKEDIKERQEGLITNIENAVSSWDKMLSRLESQSEGMERQARAIGSLEDVKKDFRHDTRKL